MGRRSGEEEGDEDDSSSDEDEWRPGLLSDV